MLCVCVQVEIKVEEEVGSSHISNSLHILVFILNVLSRSCNDRDKQLSARVSYVMHVFENPD